MQLPPSDHCLIVYGTLAPGEKNHHIVVPFGGEWKEGEVRGRRFICRRYPSFEWDEAGDSISVKVLISQNINWEKLDQFEGEDYQRIKIPVKVGENFFLGNIYAHRKRD